MTLLAPRAAGSYDPAATVAGGIDAECARLETQAELTFADELPVLVAAVAAGGGPLLEVGAGSGAVTRRLREAFPGVPVVALDVDAALLGRVGGGPRIAADAYRLPVASGSVGTVLLRYVVQHLGDPAAVLLEVRRVLRPDGRVVVTDVDQSTWGVAEPSYPELEAVYRRLAVAQQRDGGDRTVARRLTRLLRAAGLIGVRLHPFATTNDARPTDDFAAHLGPDRLVPLVASGAVSMAELALTADRWQRFRRDPDAWVMLLGFSAVGVAPADEEGL